MKLDAAHVELLAFVHIENYIHGLFFIVEICIGNAGVIDVASFAIGFAEVLDSLGHFFAAENVPILHGDEAAQSGVVLNGFVVLKRDGAQAVAIALLDRHGDIDGFPQPRLDPRNVEARASGVVDFGFGFVHQYLEIPAVLELGANAFGVFFQFGGVVGLGEQVFQKDRVRDADGLQVLHGRPQRAVVDVFVAPEAYAPNLDLGPFLDHKRDGDGGRRDGSNFGADGGELMPVFREQFLQHNFRLLDFGGIVLALYRESDFAVLEAVEHVAGGDRAQAAVADLADGGPFFEVDVQDPALAFGVLLALEAYVLKVVRVPEGVEVALDGGVVIHVADLGEDASPDRIGGNAAVAVDNDANHQILLADDGDDQQQQPHQPKEAVPDRPLLPNSCSGKRGWRPGRVSL